MPEIVTRKRVKIAAVIAGAVVVIAVTIWLMLPRIAGWGMKFKTLQPYAHKTIVWLGPRADNQMMDIECFTYDGSLWKLLKKAESDQDTLAVLLSSLGDPNRQTWDGFPLIHCASWQGCQNIVEGLLEAGADVNITSQIGWTPLHAAANWKRIGAMKVLLNHGANVNARARDGITPLSCALCGGCSNSAHEAVNLLISRGADVKAEDFSLTSPLHWAAGVSGNADIIRELVSLGAYVNRGDGHGKTPLHRAKYIPENAKALIDAGADVNARDNDGSTPLHDAAFGYSKEVVDVLLEGSADVNAINNAGVRPLHNAARWAQADVVKALLDRGADINAKAKDGLTPLLCAVENRNSQVIELLLRSGADMSVRYINGFYEGRTAFDFARMNNWNDVVEPLRKHGAKTGAELDEEEKKGEAKTPEQENSRPGEQ